MGAWNSSSFGNDAASDLLLRLEELASSDQLSREVAKPFQGYAAFEGRRSGGDNSFTISEAYIEDLIAQLGQGSGTEGVISRLRASVGTLSIDDGGYEADEAIASSEIVLACTTKDFSRLPEEGAFLERVPAFVKPQDLRDACSALRLVLKNKVLLKSRGPKWRRNIENLLEQINRQDLMR